MLDAAGQPMSKDGTERAIGANDGGAIQNALAGHRTGLGSFGARIAYVGDEGDEDYNERPWAIGGFIGAMIDDEDARILQLLGNDETRAATLAWMRGENRKRRR